jgi:hypothetical protein
LFFRPIGRRQGAVEVDVQSKDAPPQPPFRIILESESEGDELRLVRLRAEDGAVAAEADLTERVYQAIATLPSNGSRPDQTGVTIKTLADHLKYSEKSVRRALTELRTEDRIVRKGKIARGADLWAVVAP